VAIQFKAFQAFLKPVILVKIPQGLHICRIKGWRRNFPLPACGEGAGGGAIAMNKEQGQIEKINEYLGNPEL
jgi:hypothetical protein